MLIKLFPSIINFRYDLDCTLQISYIMETSKKAVSSCTSVISSATKEQHSKLSAEIPIKISDCYKIGATYFQAILPVIKTTVYGQV